jgi:hypothetical protein
MRPTIQIYEGVDGAGKTTTVESRLELARKHGLRAISIHHGPPREWQGQYTWREYYIGRTLQAIHDGYDVIVLDRSWVSHMVYTTLQGEPQLFSDRTARDIAHVYDLLGASYWYVDRPNADIAKSLTERGEFLEVADIAVLKTLYENTHEKLHGSVKIGHLMVQRTVGKGWYADS